MWVSCMTKKDNNYTMSNITIYVLQCRDNKFYVGKSERPIRDRILEHFTSCGSEWTMLYKPHKVVEIKENADNFDEDKTTKIYMSRYGIDNVRGGSYTSKHLPEFQKEALAQELNTSENRCFRCGRKGHFANHCYARVHIEGSLLEDSDGDESDEDKEDDTCFRCGRNGHFANNCYAKTDVNGCWI